MRGKNGTLTHGNSGYAHGCRCETCKVGHREYNRQWQRKPENIEKIRERAREWAENNPERRAETGRLYREANKEELSRKKALDRLQRKLRAIAILGGKCSRCGFDAHPAALQFHHLDPTQKLFNLAVDRLVRAKKYPWEMVLEEIKKCELVCSNCHAIEHSVWTDEDIENLRAVPERLGPSPVVIPEQPRQVIGTIVGGGENRVLFRD